MSRKIAIVFVLIFVGGASIAQFSSPERGARKSLAKKRWEKTRQFLNRALTKDSINAAANYTYSQYFFHPENPANNIDSAYKHVTRSLDDLTSTSEKERYRLKRVPVDSVILIRLRDRIDSAAFERATSLNTEPAFLHFLEAFPFAIQREQAVVLRDEAAFQDAVKVNTYKAFLNFVEKYPFASRSGEARERYHKLLFESKTRPGTLFSYQQFLAEYPSTPYRAIVEKNIFEISTASGTATSFLAFLQKFPGSSFSTQARNFLFHLLLEKDESSILRKILNDSLKKIVHLNESYLIPILRDGHFGFIDKSGQVIIQPQSNTIPAIYKCGNIGEDVLINDNNLIGRDGSVIFRDSIAEMDDLGSGFLKILAKNCVTVVHKSGYIADSCSEDSKLMAGRFIASRKNNLWSLKTFSGRILSQHQWEDVTTLHDIIILKKDGRYQLTTAEVLAGLADQTQLRLTGPFDEVKGWGKEMIWVRNGPEQGILNSKLNYVLELEHQNLKQTFFGGLSQKTQGCIILNEAAEEVNHFKEIEIHEPWVAVLTDSAWRFYDPTAGTFTGKGYDSIFFNGPFAGGLTKDSLMIHINPAMILKLPGDATIVFIPGRDSTAFLMVKSEKKKEIFNIDGAKLFTADYDEIQYAGEGLFIVSRKEKKGLVNSEGKIVLPVEFQAIGSVNSNVISLLKNMRFGAYNIKLKKLIKPQYEKNLTSFNASLLTAYQQGEYGFIDWDNKPQSKSRFGEIQYWTDTLALVKKNYHWGIYNTNTSQMEEEFIYEINYITDNSFEKLAIIRQDNAFGVLSNRRGFIIPPTFTNLLNLGSADEPLYFTEKHVEEASIFVVIYYDEKGKMLLRQVFEEKDREKILCVEN